VAHPTRLHRHLRNTVQILNALNPELVWVGSISAALLCSPHVTQHRHRHWVAVLSAEAVDDVLVTEVIRPHVAQPCQLALRPLKIKCRNHMRDQSHFLAVDDDCNLHEHIAA
jgi:hypothetical protein